MHTQLWEQRRAQGGTPGRWTLLSPTNQTRRKPSGLLGPACPLRKWRVCLLGLLLGTLFLPLPLDRVSAEWPQTHLRPPCVPGFSNRNACRTTWSLPATPLPASLHSWGSSRPLQLTGLIAARPVPWSVLLLGHRSAGHPLPSLCPNITSWRSLLSPWPCLHLDPHILLSFIHSSCHPQKCSVCS